MNGHQDDEAAGVVDLVRVAAGMGVDLPAAFAQLAQIYEELDAHLAARSASLDLPCRQGCDMCCHESVFITPLEFFYAWQHVQTELTAAARAEIVAAGLQIYAAQQARIEALNTSPLGEHDQLARALRFRCPLLSAAGGCQIYPARELTARLFGQSFLDGEGTLYGCVLVRTHLLGRSLRLPSAVAQLRRLRGLPLTHMRQVYPYYIQLLYGADVPGSPQAIASR